jgi:hypothetical protein
LRARRLAGSFFSPRGLIGPKSQGRRSHSTPFPTSAPWHSCESTRDFLINDHLSPPQIGRHAAHTVSR